MKKNKFLFAIYNNLKCILIYNYYKLKGKLHVYSIEDTAEKLLSDKYSMVRFGDYEMEIILGNNTGYQEYNRLLAKRLKYILGSNEEYLLVCIPDVFEGLAKYKNKEDDCRPFWMHYVIKTRKEWEKICKNKNYYNAFISRPYIGILDKKIAGIRFSKIKSLWNNKNVILIEGKYSRVGCGNDLFDNVKSLKRILCPAKNAYRKYIDILKEIMKHDKEKLILLSLGPTAKVLVFDLYKEGYRSLDIGHIDIEYEWFLREAKEKIKIPNKYVNEVEGGTDNLQDYYDEKYESEIIAKL
jgi:glycosyltransferase family protein